MKRLKSAGLLFAGFWLLSSPAHALDAAIVDARDAAERSQRPPAYPRDVFLQSAALRDVSLSPGGDWMAFRRESLGRVALWLENLDSGERTRVSADSAGMSAYWSGDGARLWLVDGDGIGVFEIGSGAARRVFRFDGARRQAFFGVDSNAPGFLIWKERIAIGSNWRHRYHALSPDGGSRLLHDAPQPVTGLLLDESGAPRYLAGFDGDAFDTVIWRVTDDGAIEELMRCPLPERCSPIAYSGATLWAVAHHGEDLATLQRHHPTNGRWQVEHRDPRGLADAVASLMRPDGRNWLAVAYQPDRIEWHARGSDVQASFRALERELAGANLDIQPSNDGARWLVRAARADWQYDRYYLYATSDCSLEELFPVERAAHVPPAHLAEALPLQWRDADGVLLHGYVHLPKGVPLAEAPIIAFIHGGPYDRSHGTSDAATQLMVNRGYVVFKPNFRASTGYGLNYLTGSGGNFGRHGGALDDIVSGLDHLLAHGVGNARKQAVAGHSFGGYASLLAVAHHPVRFSFAFASAAPVDIGWTMKEVAIEGGSALPVDGPAVEVLFPRYGVPYSDPAWHERMRRESPLANAGRLRTPVYLWAGANDDRVAVESIVRFVAEASREHRPGLLIDPDAGHNPQTPLSREALLWLIEAATHEHFSGGLSPASPELRRFLVRNLRGDALRPFSSRAFPVRGR